MQARRVQLNWDSYEQKWNQAVGRKPLTEEQKQKKAAGRPVSDPDNHWKWADGEFDPDAFVSKLKKLSA